MRILVTGASGLLGLNFCLKMAESHEVIGLTHTHPLKGAPFRTVQADLTDVKTMAAILAEVRPGLALHCAAMADVDACEQQPERAMQLNAEAPGRLADWCQRNKIKLVHISTDAVFDGKKGDYSEEDEPNPLSVYAASKLEGEKRVMESNPDALVARVNFYGFSLGGARSLAEFFLNHLRNGIPVNGFVDVMACPLYAVNLAENLMAMVEKDLRGLYHVVSPECSSKYSFGVAIARKFGFDARLIRPVSVLAGNLKARRSPRLDLSIKKLQGEKIEPPGQAEGLEQFFRDFQEGLPVEIKNLAA